MFVKPDDAILAAVFRIQRTAEWEVIEKFLQESREALVKKSFGLDGADLYRSQGGAMVIDELFKIARGAASVAAR